MRKQGRNWDDAPVTNVAVKSLSKPTIDNFRKLAKQSGRVNPAILRESTPSLIEKLHLIDGKYLKRAAVLLFHPDPEHFVTGAFVKIGFFRNDADLLYHDEIHGDLFTQAEKTKDLLLTKYLKAGINYKGLQRIERFPVPEEALREALLNALIHKDYSSGVPIQISVYDDRLMMWNSGELPQNWTIDKLNKKHSSHPFNPDIANAFFRAGQIESWGRGIERIFNACKNAGTPLPSIRYDHGGLWVEFTFKAIPDEAKNGLGDGLGDSPQSRILRLIKSKSTISIAELSRQLEVSTTAIEKSIKRMKANGRLKRIGSAKGGHWEVIK